MKDLGFSPGTPLVGHMILEELLIPSELHFLHVLNEDTKLHKTVALRLELERASESQGELVKNRFPGPTPSAKITTQEIWGES